MNKPLPPSARQPEDTLPWYRQLWPWLLIMGPALVVVACFYTIWLAVSTADPMVVDDYYKQGLAVNRSLARDQQAQSLGLQATLQFAADGRVSIQLRAPQSVAWPDALNLVMAHPMKASRDLHINLHIRAGQDRSADYVADQPAVLEAVAYQLILQDSAASWRLTGRVNPQRQPRLELQAGQTRQSVLQ